MSVSKPMMKRPRQTPLTRTGSLDLSTIVEEKDLPTGSRPTVHLSQMMEEETTQTDLTKIQSAKRHPKGHKVHEIMEVWKTMDKQAFLHLTDQTILADVWVQPTSCSGVGAYVDVEMRQVVDAPHIKGRMTTTKLTTDDLLKILYLADCLVYDMQGVMRIEYNDWYKEKLELCISQKGDDGMNDVILCNFLINEDKTFSFYPSFLNGSCGIFFRKTCYHSYSCHCDMCKEKSKIDNPSFIKCGALNSKFEYVYEARIFPLPDAWFDNLEKLPTVKFASDVKKQTK